MVGQSLLLAPAEVPAAAKDDLRHEAFRAGH
jgi:hypothetical protein